MTAQLSYDEARKLTDKIKVGLSDTWKLVKEAYQNRADRVLNYPSWDEYCRAEFGTSWLRVPRENRPEIVKELSLAGMGVRPIASAMGIKPTTVWRAAQQATGGVPNETPTPPKPKPVPNADRYLQQFYQACANIADGSLEIQRLCKDRRFSQHRDALVKAQRENIIFAHEQLEKLLPYFEDIPPISLDEED